MRREKLKSMTPIVSSSDAAYLAFQQLEAWKARGYDPQLLGSPGGWTLILDQTRWGQLEINERNDKSVLRFGSGLHPTPIAAIQAAQEVIK